MKIRAGAMRTAITIQKPGTADGLGQVTWTDFLTVRAEVKTLTGRELDNARLGGSDANTEIVTRYVAGIQAEDRILIGTGRRFVVRYVNVETEGMPRLTHLFCREIMTA